MSKTSDDWMTPEALMAFFSDWDDPCPLRGTDGLVRDWGPRSFVNPPYSNPGPWVDKAIAEVARGKRVVLLIRHDSSTRAWQKLHQAGAMFAAVIGRLHFNDTKEYAPFPSVLVFLGPLAEDAA